MGSSRLTPEVAMRSALALARRGAGRVWPNPSVGAVVFRGARVLGRGPYIEVEAILAHARCPRARHKRFLRAVEAEFRGVEYIIPRLYGLRRAPAQITGGVLGVGNALEDTDAVTALDGAAGDGA